MIFNAKKSILERSKEIKSVLTNLVKDLNDVNEEIQSDKDAKLATIGMLNNEIDNLNQELGNNKNVIKNLEKLFDS